MPHLIELYEEISDELRAKLLKITTAQEKEIGEWNVK